MQNKPCLARPIMPTQEPSKSLLERFNDGHWLTDLQYALLLGLTISELDHRRRLGHLSPLIETRLRSPRKWEYRKTS